MCLDSFKRFGIFVNFCLIVKIFFKYLRIFVKCFCRFGQNKYLNILRFRLKKIVVFSNEQIFEGLYGLFEEQTR